MEKSRPAQNQPTQNLPDPPPSDNSFPPKSSESRKRPRDANAILRNSDYFRLRAVLSDLRPQFIEVLKTPEFRNCKAAEEIREKSKLLLDLYQQITTNSSSTLNHDPLNNSSSKLSEIPPTEKRTSEVETLGTYTIGGSAFGWNFITFPGDKPIYYGMTKESFRAAQANIQGSFRAAQANIQGSFRAAEANIQEQ